MIVAKLKGGVGTEENIKIDGNLTIHLFNQQVFLEPRLHTRPFFRHWGWKDEHKSALLALPVHKGGRVNIRITQRRIS